MRKLALLAALLSTSVYAQHMYGQVTNVSPIYSTAQQYQQECYMEQVPYQQHSNGGAMIGGIAGGLLGNTIGHGNGQIAAAAIGAATGAIVGDRMSDHGVQYQQVQRCRRVPSYAQQVSGYQVQYTFNGQSYVTQTNTPYQVGQQIPLRIVPY